MRGFIRQLSNSTHILSSPFIFAVPDCTFTLAGDFLYRGSVKVTDKGVRTAFEALINTLSIWCHISNLARRRFHRCVFSHMTFTFAESHLSDGVQQHAVGVEDDAERQDQAEGEQADDVGDIVGRLGPPVH